MTTQTAEGYGKNLLITGVANKESLAWRVAEEAAKITRVTGIVLAIYPSDNGKKRVEEMTTELPAEQAAKFRDVIFLDVDSTPRKDFNKAYMFDNLVPQVQAALGEGEYIDGVLHSIANMHPDAMGSIQNFVTAGWDKISKGMEVSAYSYLRMMTTLEPVLNPKGGSAAALTFHSDTIQPNYGWMRPTKKLLEELCKEMGVYFGKKQWAVNTVTTGVWATRAGTAIPGYDDLEAAWKDPHLQYAATNDKTAEVIFFENTARLLTYRQATTGGRFKFDLGMSDIGFCSR